jgi:hypothetical protein
LKEDSRELSFTRAKIVDDLEAFLSQPVGMFPNPLAIPSPGLKPIKQVELFKKFRPMNTRRILSTARPQMQLWIK